MLCSRDTAAKGEEKEKKDTEDDDPMTDTDEPDQEVKRHMWVNLRTKPTEMPISYDEHEAPNADGLLFQYVPELAKYDRKTVPEVIERYFYGCLAWNEEDAKEEFDGLIRACGNLFNSDFMNAYAHLYKCIDICIRMQTRAAVMVTANRYDGVFMIGGGYDLVIDGKHLIASSKAEVKKHLPNMDYHGNALWNILQKLDMLEEARLNAFRTVKRMHKLKELVDAHAMIGGQSTRDYVMKEAKYLSFPEDVALPPSAASIELVCSIISNPAADLHTLPYMHYSVLLSSKREHIAWSAFGEEAPSFRVPGGKVMHLSTKFTTTSKKLKEEQGPRAERNVTKIGAHMVDIITALEHLDKMMEEKTVWNPFGNAIVNASASHLNKIYDGESCTLVVDALRKATRTTVRDVGGSNKRPRDEGVAPGGERKKGRFDAGF